MKGIISVLIALISLLAAWFVADNGVAFVREHFHKYITLRKRDGHGA